MSFYDIDFAQQTENLICPSKRQEVTLDFLSCVVSPLQWYRDLTFEDYFEGSAAANYNGATNYDRYDRVKWTDGAIYESLVNSNLGVDPTGVTDSATNWLKVVDTFIGANTRAKYKGQIITLQKILNDHYEITAPDYIYTEHFWDGLVSLYIYIYVPVAVWTALGPTNTERDNNVKFFVKQYLPPTTEAVIFNF
jgi:hypothetical protein